MPWLDADSSYKGYFIVLSYLKLGKGKEVSDIDLILFYY
jgi:hypothetical protein